MKRALLALLLAAGGCATDLIRPEDPRYEELCVIYVAENAGAEITREIFDRCARIEIVVVRFPL